VLLIKKLTNYLVVPVRKQSPNIKMENSSYHMAAEWGSYARQRKCFGYLNMCTSVKLILFFLLHLTA